MPKPKTIAEALVAEIDRRQASQRSVCDEIGVSQQTFSRWKRDEVRPSPDYREQVARFLHMRLGDYDALWRASKRRPGNAKVDERVTELEARIDRIERLVIQVAADVRRDA